MASALEVLARGRVVAAATESFFGLFVDASRPDALDALFALKPRSAGSALVIPSLEAWSKWVDDVPDRAMRLAERFWPGPLTIALPAAARVDRRLVVDGTVGVRIPGPCAAHELCTTFGEGLTATSANRHGQPPSTRSEEVVATFRAECEGGRLHVIPGSCPGGLPSTIVSVRDDLVTIVRDGAIPRADIGAVTGRTL